MAYEVLPLSSYIGAEIRGLDPRNLNSEASDLVRRIFRDRHMVLIRDEALSEDDGVRLTETLGEVSFNSPVMKRGGERKFSFISNQHRDGTLRDGELLFHSDHTFFDSPLKAISLYSLAAPSTGGETVFSNAGAAYERLPAPLKSRLENLRARHIATYGTFEGAKRPKFDPGGKAFSAIHPVVWRHPETGQPLLFINRLLTESILGLEPDASEALLEELFAYIEDPQYLYIHKWRVGDYLVWDNRQLQHSRRDFPPTEKRALRRVPIAESRNVA